jgi:hypothetical protein
MMADLAFFPAWYGNEGDYVIMNETSESFRFLLSIPACIRPAILPIQPSKNTLTAQNTLTGFETLLGLRKGFGFDTLLGLRTGFDTLLGLRKELRDYEAAPWGLSPHSIRLFETYRNPDEYFIIPPWKETYKRLTGRQTALECLSRIKTLMPDAFESLTLPRFCTTTDEIRRFIAEYPPPYLLKTPYSCSGRGIYRIQERDLDLQASRWVEGALKKQDVISIEQALDKVCDFAMEFESHGNGQIRFEGLSVFDTSSKGEYHGNLLGSQQMLKQHITTFIPVTLLREIQEAVVDILTEVLGFEYRGYLGVDMLIFKRDHTFAVHPFIEINLRYTMGFVALKVSTRLIHPSSQGQLIVTYDKAFGKAYYSHLQMEQKYPLQLSDSKIRSGYLSLCPVTPETQFRAYLLVAG